MSFFSNKVDKGLRMFSCHVLLYYSRASLNDLTMSAALKSNRRLFKMVYFSYLDFKIVPATDNFQCHCGFMSLAMSSNFSLLCNLSMYLVSTVCLQRK